MFLRLHHEIPGMRIGVENGFRKSGKQRIEDKASKNKLGSIAPGFVVERSVEKRNAPDEPYDATTGAVRAANLSAVSLSSPGRMCGGPGMGYLFCFLRAEELRSLNCAFNFETSSRSAAISFCTPADPGPSFDSRPAPAGTEGERKEASTAGEGWRPMIRPRAGRRSNDGLDGASDRPAFAIRRTPRTPAGSKRPRNP